MTRSPGSAAAICLACLLSGCGDEATLPAEAGIGAKPTLPPPHQTLLPTVAIAPAKGWPDGKTPVPGEGLSVAMFASGLTHPRSLLVLPNGDVLVTETDAPPKPEDTKGIKGWAYKLVQERAGADTPSANRVTLLRDADGDGKAETRSAFIEGLYSPFGMALVGDQLFVANTDAVLRFPYHQGETRIAAPGVKLVDLPAGPINHHWTKNLVASPDGRHLYASIGSNSNAAENGIAAEDGRAAIWEIDPSNGAHRIFASGLRNPNGLSWEPKHAALWTAVNERDELGSDLVPDYMTAVKEGGFYGWPYSYYGAHRDPRVTKERPDLVASAIVPDYALGAHTASLGLAITADSKVAPRYAAGAFVAQHGSWNRRPRSGYKVIFVPFEDGRPAGEPIDVLTGFVDDDGDALGRPVSVAPDGRGGVLVVDDVGGAVWRVTARQPPQAALTPR
jgi:glucose/arabinose dehydrogenase